MRVGLLLRALRVVVRRMLCYVMLWAGFTLFMRVHMKREGKKENLCKWRLWVRM